MTYYLKPGEIKLLIWEDSELNHHNMIRKGTYTDGSCYFHAIVEAYFVPYKSGMIGGRPFSRKQFIKDFRLDLAKKLSEINEKDDKKRTYHKSISNGKLTELQKDSLLASIVSEENMKKELSSNNSVSYIFHEMVSDLLNKDIYILDAKNKNVYIIDSNTSLYYKNRKSIVLLWIKGHYEVVGVRNDSIIRTFFSPEDPFIVSIKSQITTRTNFSKNP